VTETRLTGLLIKTGSVPAIAITNFAGNVTASLPAGTVSSSTQVTANLPTGAISSSAQVNYAELQNIPTGIASSSAQIKAYLPTDSVSSSIQVTAFLPNGTVSSSTQLPDGIASSSAQVTAYLPANTVSSSGQVSYTGLSNTPVGIVSSSGQVSYTGLSNIPVGIVSSSTQVTTLLPNGTVSSSAQIPTRTFTVTNSGASAYAIDGVNNSSLTLIRGFTYNFSVNASGHPFWIKTAQVTGTGNAYSNGVTNNGTAVGTITFTVPYDAPDTLYYICQFHSSMTGVINIKDIQPSGLVSSSAQYPGWVTGSSQIDITATTGYSTFSSSLSAVDAGQNTRLNTLESATSSYAVTTGQNIFNANQIVSGTLTITSNLVVQGSSSISFISQSTLNIGTNIITVNTNSPGTRFGGLEVIDSGSSPQRSGSLLFDSANDQWIFVHQNTAGGVTSSVLVMGPATFNNIGNETLLTQNRLIKGSGLEHVASSIITDDGTNVGIGSDSPSTKLDVSGNTKTSAVLLPGSTSGTVTLQAAATAGTTTITLPATTGTVITTGDSSTVTNTMLAGSIANAKLANSTISGISLGSNLATLTIGSGLSGTSYNGSTAVTISISSGAITNAMLANSTISGISLGSNLNTLTLGVSGTGLSGTATYNGSGAATFTVTSNATSANTGGAIVARDGSGNFSAGTVTAALSGNASSATTFSTTRTNYKGVTDAAVAGQMMWKHYGNNHTIIDASNSTAPDGSSINNTNSAVAWTGTYPTLVGWNGSSTYGVRVDSARIADSISSQANSATITATSANTGNQIVLRDGSGNFSAGTITATLSGTATTGTNWGSYGAVPAAGTSFGNANTIGRSDANGYAFFGYINSSTGNSENPSVSQVIVTNGSDSYYRKASIAHLTSAVQSNASGNWAINAATITSQANSATITADTAASANTIVRRDASGHITGAYIFGSYFNASAGNSENPTIGQIWTQNTSDNYLRKSTPAHLISQLGLITTSNYSSYAIPISGGINMSGGFGLNDSRLYLRTNGDTNHYLWNAADDWEELVFYTGTGFRIAGSNGSSYATVTTNGIACGTITSTYYNSGDGVFLFRYGSTSGVTRHINLSNSTTDPSAASVDSGISWGQRADNQAYYLVYCTQENYNGNYNKLTLNWHTGIRIGAAAYYGGTTFYDNSLNISSTILFSVGRGDSNVRATNTFYAGGDVVAYSSDIRLKENIKPIDNAIDKIMKLNGVYYTWKDMVTDVGFTPLQKDEVGVLAQEVQEVLPEVVTAAPFDCEIDPPTGKTQSKSGQNYLTVKYEKLVPLLIEAIKEQQTTIQQLNSRIEALESK